MKTKKETKQSTEISVDSTSDNSITLLHDCELLEVTGGSFAYDVAFALRYIGTYMIPGGGPSIAETERKIVYQ